MSDNDLGITMDAVNAIKGTLKAKKDDFKEKLMELLNPAIDDYSQLMDKDKSSLPAHIERLKKNISQHIPSNEDFKNPEAMSEWSQRAALNAPMGLVGGLRHSDIWPPSGSRSDVAVGGEIPNGFNKAMGGRGMPANMPSQDRHMRDYVPGYKPKGLFKK